MSDGAMVEKSPAADTSEASCYRVKFDRENFLELVRHRTPKNNLPPKKHVLLCLRRFRHVLRPMQRKRFLTADTGFYRVLELSMDQVS